MEFPAPFAPPPVLLVVAVVDRTSGRPLSLLWQCKIVQLELLRDPECTYPTTTNHKPTRPLGQGGGADDMGTQEPSELQRLGAVQQSEPWSET